METKIVRTDDIVVDSARLNQYGDLLVTDKGGKEHKISKKRERLFSVFRTGQAVHLSYAIYMEKEYIADAISLNQIIKTTEPEVKKPVKVEPVRSINAEIQENMKWKAEQERYNLCLQELGQNIRLREFQSEKDPAWLLRKAFYYTTIDSVLGIEIKEEKK